MGREFAAVALAIVSTKEPEHFRTRRALIFPGWWRKPKPANCTSSAPCGHCAEPFHRIAMDLAGKRSLPVTIRGSYADYARRLPCDPCVPDDGRTRDPCQWSHKLGSPSTDHSSKAAPTSWKTCAVRISDETSTALATQMRVAADHESRPLARYHVRRASVTSTSGAGKKCSLIRKIRPTISIGAKRMSRA